MPKDKTLTLKDIKGLKKYLVRFGEVINKIDYSEWGQKLVEYIEKKYDAFKSEMELIGCKEQLEIMKESIIGKNNANQFVLALVSIIQTPEFQEKLFNFIDQIPENIEDLILFLEFLDVETFLELKSFLKRVEQRNTALFTDALITYKESKKNFFPINTVLSSILVFRQQEKLEFLGELEEYKDLRDEKFDSFWQYFMFFPKLNYKQLEIFLDAAKEESFHELIFDFGLKYGYIIEGFIFNILKFLVKCDLILRGKPKQELLTVDGMVFSNVLKYFPFGTLLAKYRNSIFHSSFISKIQDEKREIVFNLKRPVVLSVKEFIENFVKILLLHNTISYVIFLYDPEFKEGLNVGKSFIKNLLKEIFNSPTEEIVSFLHNFPQELDEVAPLNSVA